MSQIENKVIKLYNQKQYKYDVGSFLNFVHEKIKLDSFGVDLVKQKIEDFGIQGSFDEMTFRLLLRLVTVVQLKSSEVTGMNRNQIEKFQTSISFKSKKQKNSQKVQQKESNGYVQSQNLPIKEKYKEEIKQVIKQTKINQPPQIDLQQKRKQSDQSKQIRNFETQKSSQRKNKPHKQEHVQKRLKKQLPSIEQVDNSSEIKLTQSYEDKGPKFLDMTDSRDETSKVKITQYQKFSADYMNPVIKFTIIYKNKRVLRRFSEFQKLINILRQKYEGFILPKLPPKQGIKAGINYFWGIDQAFLQQRKKKLQQMMNRLLSNKIINEEPTLKSFLTDQYFQIEVNKESYSSYLKGITDVVFNAKQLKDFGVAYYNYFREKGNVKLDNDIDNKYSQILEVIGIFTVLDNYRKKINKNFDKRRQLIHDLSIKSRNPQNSDFDKIMCLIEEEIQDLNFEMENYKQLKCQQSWIMELIKQKEGDGQRTLYELKEQQGQLGERLKKIEKNLRYSLEQFYQSKKQGLVVISGKVVQWRVKVHP